jgi:hypothetical protein
MTNRCLHSAQGTSLLTNGAGMSDLAWSPKVTNEESDPSRLASLDEDAHVDLRRPLPKSRTFKKLKGDPVPDSTHELYAWSDGATGRLLGHYEDGGDFVFDYLAGHP